MATAVADRVPIATIGGWLLIRGARRLSRCLEILRLIDEVRQMLIDGSRDAIWQRTHPVSPEANRGTTANRAKLTGYLFGALVLRDWAIDPQMQRDQPTQRLGQRRDIRACLADIDEYLQQAIIITVEGDVDLTLWRAHLTGIASNDLWPLFDATAVASPLFIVRCPCLDLSLSSGGGLWLLVFHADVEHLLALAAVTEDGDAKAAQIPGQHVRVAHIIIGSAVGQIDGLADTVIDALLEGRLHPNVPLRRNLVRGHVGRERWMFRRRMPMQRAMLLDIGERLFFLDNVTGRQRPRKEWVDEIEHTIRAIGLLHTMLESQREDRLDARRTIGQDTDGAGGSDRGARGVTQLRAVLVDAALPVWEARRAPRPAWQIRRLTNPGWQA